MRKTILIGKVTRRGAEMVVLEPLGSPPFPGPWVLTALVRPTYRPTLQGPGAPSRDG